MEYQSPSMLQAFAIALWKNENKIEATSVEAEDNNEMFRESAPSAGNIGLHIAGRVRRAPERERFRGRGKRGEGCGCGRGFFSKTHLISNIIQEMARNSVDATTCWEVVEMSIPLNLSMKERLSGQS